MQAPSKQIRPRDITLVLLGDMAVFLTFVILGKTEHGLIQGGALLRTALPFAVVWCVVSPWLGAYKASTLYSLSATAWRIPSIWLVCGLAALLVRALLIDRPLIPTFALVALAVQGALLVSWRSVFMLVTSWFFRP